MNIRDIRTWVVAVAPGINWVFLRVDTDAGLHGWGEATLEGRDDAVLGALAGLARELLGQPVPAPEVAWRRAFRGSAWRGADLLTAMSAIDHALWDLRGKRLNASIGELLGGPVRERLHTYTWAATSAGIPSLAESVRYAHDRWGFTHFKIAPLVETFTMDSEQLIEAVALVDEVVDALPSGGKVAIEGHQRLHPAAAVDLASALTSRPIFFLEDLVLSGDQASMRALRDRTALPIAAGEKTYTRWDVWPWLTAGLVDYLTVDVCHAGGISELFRIATVAEAAGVPVVPHNPNGPVGMAATLQVAAAHPNVVATESVYGRFDLMRALAGAAPTIAGGYAMIPDAPGLGIELDEAALVAHAGTSHRFPFEGDYDVPSGRL